MKYVRVPTQDCLLSSDLLTFTTRLLIFVYYVYALVLLTQYCINILVTFQAIHTHTHTIWKYQTTVIIGPSIPPYQSIHKKVYSTTEPPLFSLSLTIRSEVVTETLVHLLFKHLMWLLARGSSTARSHLKTQTNKCVCVCVCVLCMHIYERERTSVLFGILDGMKHFLSIIIK